MAKRGDPSTHQYRVVGVSVLLRSCPHAVVKSGGYPGRAPALTIDLFAWEDTAISPAVIAGLVELAVVTDVIFALGCSA